MLASLHDQELVLGTAERLRGFLTLLTEVPIALFVLVASVS
jgi:hypothetical protein